MSATSILIIISCCATAHLVITSVLALFARHRVEYLCLAWINGIFGFVKCTLSSAVKNNQTV